MHDLTWPQNPTAFWIISPGRYTETDLSSFGIFDTRNPPVKEYLISDFARYLISPDPVEFEKRLVGCEVHYHRHTANRKRSKIWQILPQGLQRLRKEEPQHSELFIPPKGLRIPRLNDNNLEKHLNKLYRLLKSHDPIYQGLADLDRSKISDIVGICEDLGGSRTWLRLRGSIDAKIEYIGREIFNNVGVVLEKAYLSEGVFELRGFNFEGHTSTDSHRLLKFFQGGQNRACVLDSDRQIEFWLEELPMINYLHLLHQSIDMNPLLKDAFAQFLNGEAQPLKLLFKQNLAIDYSQIDLPTVYRQAIRDGQMGHQDRQTILSALIHRQWGVSVHYLPGSDSINDQLLTNLSVMHDFKALDSIKSHLPDLYANIKNQAALSDAGNFYLLDAITGYQDVE